MDLQLLTFDLWTVLLIIGIVLGMLIIPFLVSFKKRTGNFLAALVLIMVLNLGNYLLISSGAYTSLSWLIGIFQPLLFLIGPLYYFYVRAVLNSSSKIESKHWPHFLLFLAAVYYHSRFFLLPDSVKVNYINYMLSLSSFRPAISMAIYVLIHGSQGLFYCILAGKKLSDEDKDSLDQPSKNGLISWIQATNKVLGLFWVLIIVWAIYLFFASNYYQIADYIVMLAMSFMVSTPAIILIYNQQSFKDFSLALCERKYRHSSLSKDHSAAILKRLLEYMESEKPYLNQSLKIGELAKEISISTNLLSQVINQELSKNFHEFINEYRISEAIARLRNPKYSNLTILGIALEVGFNNKNTFNRLFKRHTGQTPTQFLRN